MSEHQHLLADLTKVEHARPGQRPRLDFSRCRDLLWAALFIANLALVFGFGGFYFHRYHNEMFTSDVEIAGEPWKPDMRVFALLAVVLSTAAGVSFMYLVFIQTHTSCLIWMSLLFCPLLTIIMGISTLYMGSIMSGLIMFAAAGLNLLWIFAVQDRIAFAVAMLTTVVKIIRTYPATVVAAFFGLMLQIGWVIGWGLSLAAVLWGVNREYVPHVDEPYVAGQQPSQDTGPGGLITAAYVLSFYWTAQVIANIVHVTVCGVAGTWFFQGVDEVKNPTIKAFFRASVWSLGSIAFGSFLIAAVRFIRYMLQQMKKNAQNDMVQCCLDCCLGFCESILEYFTMYTFVRVGLYGEDFLTAGSRTAALFKSWQGFWAFINDSIVSSILLFGEFAAAILTALVTAVCAKYVFHQPDWGVWALGGALVGFVVSMCAMVVIQSSVATIYVCMSDDPATLRHRHPADFNKLYEHFSDDARNDIAPRAGNAGSRRAGSGDHDHV